jgi:hypothetical protein
VTSQDSNDRSLDCRQETFPQQSDARNGSRPECTLIISLNSCSNWSKDTRMLIPSNGRCRKPRSIKTSYLVLRWNGGLPLDDVLVPVYLTPELDKGFKIVCTNSIMERLVMSRSSDDAKSYRRGVYLGPFEESFCECRANSFRDSSLQVNHRTNLSY